MKSLFISILLLLCSLNNGFANNSRSQLDRQAESLASRAFRLHFENKNDVSETLQRKVVAIRREIIRRYGRGYLIDLVEAESTLALYLMSQNKYVEAGEIYWRQVKYWCPRSIKKDFTNKKQFLSIRTDKNLPRKFVIALNYLADALIGQDKVVDAKLALDTVMRQEESTVKSPTSIELLRVFSSYRDFYYVKSRIFNEEGEPRAAHKAYIQARRYSRLVGYFDWYAPNRNRLTYSDDFYGIRAIEELRKRYKPSLDRYPLRLSRYLDNVQISPAHPVAAPILREMEIIYRDLGKVKWADILKERITYIMGPFGRSERARLIDGLIFEPDDYMEEEYQAIQKQLDEMKTFKP